MVSVNSNHQKGSKLYWELATSIRIDSDIVKKIYIRYLGKNPSHVNLENMRIHTASKQDGLEIQEKAEKLKGKLRAIKTADLMSGKGVHRISEKEYHEALATTISTHGILNGLHLRWLRHELGEEDPSIYDLDRLFAKKINSKDEITNVIMKLTSQKGKEYYDNLQEISKLESIVKVLKKNQSHKANLAGYGGAYDMNEEDELSSYKIDAEFQTGYGDLIKSYEREILTLSNKNGKFEKANEKELEILKSYLRLDKINQIQLNMDIDFDHRHHINDVMEVYANVKRYKLLQIAKIRFRDQITSDEQALKMQFVNEESKLECFSDIQNAYAKTFTFDYASDYIDKKIFKPIALQSWEQGNTKTFLNRAVKLGYLTKQLVEREKGNSKVHYLVNFIDTINEGKSNLLRKYSGISKRSMTRLITHESLDFIERIIETNNERKTIGKRSLKFDKLFKIYRSTLISKNIRNEKEFAFLLSLTSNQDIRDSCRAAINVFNVNTIFDAKEVLKESSQKVLPKRANKKEIVSEEQAQMEIEMREYYGENWREVLDLK